MLRDAVTSPILSPVDGKGQIFSEPLADKGGWPGLGFG